ncbi:MAG: hypothetical protein ACPG8W_25515 [Candidatus Promineifilaceae bacterium]
MSTHPDPLGDLLNDFDEVASSRSAEKTSSASTDRKRSKSAFRSGLAESKTDRRQAAKATGKKSSVAGKYIRRSFTFRPDQLDQIDSLAAQVGLSKNDLVRWFIDMGVEAVNDGELPPVAAEIRHRYAPST